VSVMDDPQRQYSGKALRMAGDVCRALVWLVLFAVVMDLLVVGIAWGRGEPDPLVHSFLIAPVGAWMQGLMSGVIDWVTK